MSADIQMEGKTGGLPFEGGEELVRGGPLALENAFCNEDTPTEFLNSADPIPIKEKRQNSLKRFTHGRNIDAKYTKCK